MNQMLNQKSQEIEKFSSSKTSNSIAQWLEQANLRNIVNLRNFQNSNAPVHSNEESKAPLNLQNDQFKPKEVQKKRKKTSQKEQQLRAEEFDCVEISEIPNKKVVKENQKEKTEKQRIFFDQTEAQLRNIESKEKAQALELLQDYKKIEREIVQRLIQVQDKIEQLKIKCQFEN